MRRGRWVLGQKGKDRAVNPMLWGWCAPSVIDYSSGFSKHIWTWSEPTTALHWARQNTQVLSLNPRLACDPPQAELMLILLSREDYPKYRPRNCALWGQTDNDEQMSAAAPKDWKGVNRNDGYPTASLNIRLTWLTVWLRRVFPFTPFSAFKLLLSLTRNFKSLLMRAITRMLSVPWAFRYSSGKVAWIHSGSTQNVTFPPAPPIEAEQKSNRSARKSARQSVSHAAKTADRNSKAIAPSLASYPMRTKWSIYSLTLVFISTYIYLHTSD